MRILKFSAALALIAGSFGLATAADAQRHDDRRGRVEHVERGRGDIRRGEARRDHARRDDRRYRRDDRRYRRDARRDDRRGYRNARHCRTEWRHNRRIRVCR